MAQRNGIYQALGTQTAAESNRFSVEFGISVGYVDS